MAIEKEAIKQKCPIFDPLFKRVRTWSPEQQHEFQEYYLSQIAQRNTRQSTELLAKHMEQERHFFYFPFVEKNVQKPKILLFQAFLGESNLSSETKIRIPHFITKWLCACYTTMYIRARKIGLFSVFPTIKIVSGKFTKKTFKSVEFDVKLFP